MSRAIDPLIGRSTAPRDEGDDDIAGLYLQHAPRLRALAAAITFDRGLAEELVHEAFAACVAEQAALRNPVGFLQRVVINRSIDAVRRRRVAQAAPPQIPAAQLPSAEAFDTWEAVLRLPARQRAVVLLRYRDDLTVDEVAAALGWPAGSVKSTLHRALRRLKEEL